MFIRVCFGFWVLVVCGFWGGFDLVSAWLGVVVAFLGVWCNIVSVVGCGRISGFGRVLGVGCVLAGSA